MPQTDDDFAPKHSEIAPNDLSYGDTKEQNIIVIERLPKDIKDAINPPLKTFIFTDNTVIDCVGEFLGFVLNDKGQTVERL